MNDDEILALLRSNHGFDDPQSWIEFARRENFRPVNVKTVLWCPDCAEPGGRRLGQYVYYSSLLRLRECLKCSLIYSDGLLSADIIEEHFEKGYKDDYYFRESRSLIFEQIVKKLSADLRSNARVLDIGGAKGHLLSSLRSERPDLALVLNDMSTEACSYAEREFGLKAHVGRIFDLPHDIGTFDAVLLIDVMYYEADIAAMWRKLDELLRPGGMIIIRVPNRVCLIRIFGRLINQFSRHRFDGFNPEQLTFLSSR